MNNRCLVRGIVYAIHETLEKLDMALIERAVGIEVAESAVGQFQAALYGLGRSTSELYAGAFQNQDHAKKSNGIAALNRVIGIGHHQLRLGKWAEGEINEIDPHTIQIGAPVKVVFHRAAEDVMLPRWVLA